MSIDQLGLINRCLGVALIGAYCALSIDAVCVLLPDSTLGSLLISLGMC
jgi:hypothetical protein